MILSYQFHQICTLPFLINLHYILCFILYHITPYFYIFNVFLNGNMLKILNKEGDKMNIENKRNFKIYLSLILLNIILLMVLFPLNSVKAYKDISPKDVVTMLSSKKAILIDLRTPKEYESGHIKEAKNFPLQILMQEMNKSSISKDTPIILYCQSGIRAKNASKLLEKLGYKEVYNLGGINSWPYKIVK